MIVAVFTLVVFAALVCVGGAEMAFSLGLEKKDASLIGLARRMNPFVSEYFYEEYRLTKDIALLREAIRLDPGKAQYHMIYGQALLKQPLRTRASDREAADEVCKAARLKPYSKPYRTMCAQLKAVIPLP